MNCSDYDDGSPTRFSWGNQSYRESKGLPPYRDEEDEKQRLRDELWRARHRQK